MASPIPAQAQAGAGIGQEDLPARSPGAPQPCRPGGLEDRYRSLFLIGRGGMGTVEVALERGTEGFERVVALKRLLPEGARDPRHKEMFLREARLAALLAHPNVVHAFAFGELYGELFMAMEYVEGEPLSHVLRTAQESDRGLAPMLVAFVLAQVCDGLHAAHELRDKGGLGQPLHVVHRDVSPHNVMIAYEGFVKLLDFGVAKFETGGSETRTGEVKGKMAYMSPEQALGEKLDRRSDLYSIGAVLFECLTGRRMWGSGTDLEVMRKLALENPPRLDAIMASAPPALVDLHARLIARDPEKRPTSALEVAEELRDVASSSLRAPDAEAVRALMRRLFGQQAQGRRAQLTESLRQAAPTRVEELRRGLEPQLALDRPTSTEPLIVQSPPLRPAAPEKSRATWVVAMLLLALLGAVMATSAALRKNEPAGRSTSAAATPTSTSTSASTPTATSPPTSTSAPTTTPTPTSPPTPTSTLIPTSTSTPAPPPTWRATPAQPAPSRLSPAVQAPAPASTKLPDVDPTPF